jgi:hypothetical protein
VVVSVTVIGAYVAPVGTVTVRDVEEAELTAALVAPKNTMSLSAVALKPTPAMVTTVPMGPEVGENDAIVGVWATAVLVNIPARTPAHNALIVSMAASLRRMTRYKNAKTFDQVLDLRSIENRFGNAIRT